jgi:integrase
MEYLFQRKPSPNWSIRLQTPGGKAFEKSLGTPDKREAEVIALQRYSKEIEAHKTVLLAARPRLQTAWQPDPRYTPRPQPYPGENGELITATERELIFYSADGELLRKAPNGGPAHFVMWPEGSKPTLHGIIEAAQGVIGRSAVPGKNGDDAILETYLKHASVNPRVEREAREMWALYKRLTDGRPLKDATRDDGRKLVAHFEAEGLKSASIQKRVGWLRAAVNLAIDEGKLKFNPFAGVVPKRDDKERRLPLSDADMREAKRNLGKLADADALLFRVLASTGMRLSEAFEIDGEEKEKGCRFVVVGKKTDQSLRRVPLPATLLPFIPATIKGKLFDGGAPAASKRLNRFLNDCGIVDKRKVVHSLRHRAQDRLRAAGCPEDIRWAILGHEEETVAAGYGEGFPVPMLKKWIDKIGM